MIIWAIQTLGINVICFNSNGSFMYMVVWMWHMCVLCTPGALVVRTRVVCNRRGQRYFWYPLLLTYVTDTEPLRSEMNTLLLFCRASEEKKTMPWCNASQLSAQWIWEKDHKTFSTEKTWWSWWLSRTSISNYIFFFFIQTIVQYLQIKSFLITLSTCNICFVSFFKLIILYISNIQITNLLETYTKRFKVVVFFLTGLNPLKHQKKNHGGVEAFWKNKHAVLHGISSLYIKTIFSIINWFHF